MEYLIGIGLGIVVSAYAAIVGLDRDRAFYSTILAVIPGYYVLFAIMGGSMQALVAECAVTAVFLVVVTIGFMRNLWLVAAGLLAHGVSDFFHLDVIANPGAPAWWAGFCMAIDVVFAGVLAWLLWRSRVSVATAR